MYNLCVAIMALFVLISSFPVYSVIRKSQGLEGSFDIITEEPDNFEDFFSTFDNDSVEYWVNLSKSILEEKEENNNK